MVMKASCSCASSRFGTGRPLAAATDRRRRSAAPRPAGCSTPRDIDVDKPSDSSRIAPMRGGDDRQVAPEERRRARAAATLVGMPTLSSHGPRSTTALPYERSTLSSPVRTCVRGTSRGAVGCGSADLPMYSSASRLRASTRLPLSDSVTTEPSGSGMSLNRVCRRVRLRPRPSTPTSAPCGVAHRIRQHDRRLVRDAAGHQLADLRLSGPHHLGDVRHRRRRQPFRVRWHAGAFRPTPARSLTTMLSSSG